MTFDDEILTDHDCDQCHEHHVPVIVFAGYGEPATVCESCLEKALDALQRSRPTRVFPPPETLPSFIDRFARERLRVGPHQGDEWTPTLCVRCREAISKHILTCTDVSGIRCPEPFVTFGQLEWVQFTCPCCQAQCFKLGPGEGNQRRECSCGAVLAFSGDTKTGNGWIDVTVPKGRKASSLLEVK